MPRMKIDQNLSIVLVSSAPTFLEPSLRLSAYPIRSFEMGLESIDLFNRAIGPFSFDTPVLAVILEQQER